MRVLDGCDHSRRHLGLFHPQLRVHAGHHHLQPSQEILLLVKRTVLEDVDFYAGQKAERCQRLVQLGHDIELAPQVVCAQAVGDSKPGAVVGQDQVLVAKPDGRLRHLLDRASPVGPIRMTVAVAPQRLQQLPGGPAAARRPVVREPRGIQASNRTVPH